MKNIALSGVVSNVRFAANTFMMETVRMGHLVEVSDVFGQVILSMIESEFSLFGVEFNRDNVKEEIKGLAYLYLNEPEFKEFIDEAYKKTMIELLKIECC